MQSPNKYTSNIGNFPQYNSTPNQSLPKLSFQSSPEHRKKVEILQFNHHNTPLKRSFSMSAILYGEPSSKSNHYIDQLERFKRDHDVKNKEDRENQKEILMNKLAQRRTVQIKREEEHKKREDESLRQMIQKNTKILQAHRMGLLRNDTYNNRLAINPLTKKYENNMRGQNQKQLDDQEMVRKFIRANRMETVGTSGYNLINGQSTNNISKLVERDRDVAKLYEQKLEKFNQNFKLKPQSLEDFQRESASKIFKYY